MRLTLEPRMRAAIARLPRTSWFAASELLLLSLLAWQGARLAWAIVTPVDPVGAWATAGIGAGAAGAPLGGFDPFFRLAADPAAQAVTSINLKLYGVRADQATGRGSAIIALPDGQQQSFAVGDEVVPGVRLDAVRSDGVTLLRGGQREQLFLDQSTPATTVSPPQSMNMPPPGPGAAPAMSPLQGQVVVTPRLDGANVTGMILQPGGDGAMFRAAGLQPGDVLLSVNGRRVDGAVGAAGLFDGVAAGQAVTIAVDRGGRSLPLTLTVPQTAPR